MSGMEHAAELGVVIEPHGLEEEAYRTPAPLIYVHTLRLLLRLFTRLTLYVHISRAQNCTLYSRTTLVCFNSRRASARGLGAQRYSLRLTLALLFSLLHYVFHSRRDHLSPVDLPAELQAALPSSRSLSIPAGRVPHYGCQALKGGLWQDI